MTRARWKFQICPAGDMELIRRYRLDPVGQSFEGRVNDAIPFPLRFHGVNKLVIWLGPPPKPVKKDYVESGGVAEIQYPTFSWEQYFAASPAEREVLLETATKEVFRWLTSQYPDAQFVTRAAERLGWSDVPRPTEGSGP